MTIENIQRISKENFNSLQKHYSEGEAPVIPFVGSGLSTNPGLYQWEDLLRKMINHLGLHEDQFKAEFKAKEYAKIAQVVYEKSNHEEYIEFLTQAFEPTNDEASLIHVRLVRNFDTIITTNFDSILDNAAEEEGKVYKKQIMPYFSILTLLSEPTIIYLHGHKNVGRFILRTDDYELFYGEDKLLSLRDVLKPLIRDTYLVFLGFSFQDEHFRKMYEEIRINELIREQKETERYFSLDSYPLKDHYIFTSWGKDEKSNAEIYESFNRLNIKPIFFEPGKFVEISKKIHTLTLKETKLKQEIGSEALDV